VSFGDIEWAPPRLRPDLYPRVGTPVVLAAGGSVLTEATPTWSDEHAVWVITGLDAVQYVACGRGGARKLVPLADVAARALALGYTVDRAARSWAVGA
jgi:actin-like ATPase involved in cell morphogenesis